MADGLATMKGVRTEPLAVASLLVSGLLWGLTWLPLKHFAGAGLTGIAQTLLTYGAIGAIAAPFIWLQRRQWWAQRGLLAATGLFGGLANVCFTTALMFGPVMRSMLLFYLAPVWAVLGATLFLNEPLSLARLLGVAMAVAGAVLVLDGPAILRDPFAWTDFLALGSGLFYALQNLASRAADRTPVMSKSLVIFTGATIVAGGLALAVRTPLPTFDPVLTAQLAAYAALWLTLGMWTTMYGVTHLEAGRAAVLLVFELVAAVVSAMLIAGESLSIMGWTGAALITAAALIEARSGNAKGADAR
jgi:drug/metabolite transporter (DMT)-like permease